VGISFNTIFQARKIPQKTSQQGTQRTATCLDSKNGQNNELANSTHAAKPIFQLKLQLGFSGLAATGFGSDDMVD
jgi:hypothetical protein